MTIYEAVNTKSEETELKRSAGRTAADFVYAYPPDIPILVPGETITEENIRTIEELQKNGSRIVGLKEDLIAVTD